MTKTSLPLPVVDAALAFNRGNQERDLAALRQQLGEAVEAWLTRSPSVETRDGYSRDLFQFLDFAKVPS